MRSALQKAVWRVARVVTPQPGLGDAGPPSFSGSQRDALGLSPRGSLGGGLEVVPLQLGNIGDNVISLEPRLKPEEFFFNSSETTNEKEPGGCHIQVEKGCRKLKTPNPRNGEGKPTDPRPDTEATRNSHHGAGVRVAGRAQQGMQET